MRILLVNKFIFPKGGAETYTFDVGKMLEEHGHEVQYFGLENEKNIVGNRVGSYVTNMDFSQGIKANLNGGSHLDMVKCAFPYGPVDFVGAVCCAIAILMVSIRLQNHLMSRLLPVIGRNSIWILCIEMLQLLLRLGTFQLSDIFYNTVGGVVGGLIYYAAMKARKHL